MNSRVAYRFYYEEVEWTLSQLQAASPPHSLPPYLCLFHTLRRRQVPREVNDFQSFSQSPFLSPRSQTSLYRSKNKIPTVKLSALRFSAFNLEVYQKVGKETRGTPTLARSALSRPRLKCRGRSKFVHTHKSQLKMRIQIQRAGLEMRIWIWHLNGKPNCWLEMGVGMPKVKEEGPLSKARGAENAPNRLLFLCWVAPGCEHVDQY